MQISTRAGVGVIYTPLSVFFFFWLRRENITFFLHNLFFSFSIFFGKYKFASECF